MAKQKPTGTKFSGKSSVAKKSAKKKGGGKKGGKGGGRGWAAYVGTDVVPF